MNVGWCGGYRFYWQNKNICRTCNKHYYAVTTQSPVQNCSCEIMERTHTTHIQWDIGHYPTAELTTYMTYNVCESMPGWAPTIHRASNATQHTVCQLAINIATAHSHEYTMTENGSLTQYILIVFRLQKKVRKPSADIYEQFKRRPEAGQERKRLPSKVTKFSLRARTFLFSRNFFPSVFFSSQFHIATTSVEFHVCSVLPRLMTFYLLLFWYEEMYW